MRHRTWSDIQRPSQATTLYAGGLELTRSKLLAGIRGQVGWAVVRSYAFTYGHGVTQRNLLQTAQECAGEASQGACKPPTTFSWSNHPGGLTPQLTPVMIPAAQQDVETAQRIGKWVMADVNGDGLDDIVMSVQNVDHPRMDDWRVALNVGGGFAPSTLWATLPHPEHWTWGANCANGVCEDDWTLTPVDVDQDGRTDVFLDTPNPQASSWPYYRYLHALPGGGFELVDTAIPQPDGIQYDSYQDWWPEMYRERRFTRLGDVNGDGVADRVQCWNPTWNGEGHPPSYGTPIWTVHLWVPSVPGTGGPGFDPTPIPIPDAAQVTCAVGPWNVYVVDIDGAAGAELLFPTDLNGSQYKALRYQNGQFVERAAINLWIPPAVGVGTVRLIHFLDVNGDGLSDAIYTGVGTACNVGGCKVQQQAFGWPADVPFLVMNDGKRFGNGVGALQGSLGTPDEQPTDWWGDAAFPIDINGDGRMDLLMPMQGHCQDGHTDTVCWTALVSRPGVKGDFGSAQPTFASTDPAVYMGWVDTKIPWVGETSSHPAFPWFIPQVTDADGDGRQDLIAPHLTADQKGDGTFVVYHNTGPQDLLVAVTDGANPLDPGDPGFVPSVSIHYGSLVDTARTQGIDEGGAAAEPSLYLAHADAGNGCAYPRACVTGTDRVVSAYEVNDGQNRARQFALRYRDARFHRLGRGFLGFGERIVTDLDAGSGRAELYDNVTWDPVLRTFPFAAQVVRSLAWSPASAKQPSLTQIELSYGLTTLHQAFTDGNGNLTQGGGLTYFTVPLVVQKERDEGFFMEGPGQTLLQFVIAQEQSPETTLGTTWEHVLDYDGFGNVKSRDLAVDGADTYDTVWRDFENDTSSWLIGLVKQEAACSTAGGVLSCRDTSFGYTGYGEVSSVTAGDGDHPDTTVTVGYLRDVFGNVVRTIADDTLGNHRSSCTSFEPEGIFPYATRNTLGHTVLTGYDTGLGVMTSTVDPNGVATTWAHDGFGRVTEEVRADGSSTSYQLDREGNGGPQGNWWTVKVTTQESLGPWSRTELDGAGRPIHTWVIASGVSACGASSCATNATIEQRIEYDLLGRVTKRTVPWMEGDALSGAYADTYAYDAAGRVTQHTEPWGRVTKYLYGANSTSAVDWLGASSITVDALGRTIATYDRNGGETDIAYGPFGFARTVTRFGNEVTETDRDAYGRVRTEIDPDRGETDTAYDGFGEPRAIDDAAMRHFAFTYDGIGRLVQRDDTVMGVVSTTKWTYDTAAHGVGRLASVTSPAGHVDTYTYDTLSRPSTHTLKLGDTGETFASAQDYDALGHLWHVTYPSAAGVAPLVVRREYDFNGDLVALHDDASGTKLWQLQGLDGAGRASFELLGNGVLVSHKYAPASGMVEHIGAKPAWKMLGAPPVLQDLTYTYDLGLRMTSRADGLQMGAFGPATEMFQHDALDRLTCASFFTGLILPGQAPPCDSAVTYEPNGNIASKTGVGTYAYDMGRPHAVTTTTGPGGVSSYTYDAVGNQTSRPGVTLVEYTPFDLPAAYTLSDNSMVALDYDGGQHRIRKTTETQETVYLDEIYERVTESVTGLQTHRFYVAAGSSTVVVTRAPGEAEQVAYLLAEALGSVDVVAGDKASVVQRRSYDAFGAKRNPLWGQGGSFASQLTPVGFTGQEGDDELGLVNMRGRIYDPALGRFLTTDPLVSRPGYSQSWNRYSYVWNSPLKFVDPSGFDGEMVHGSGKTETFPDVVIVGEKPKAPDGAAAPGGTAAAKDAGRDDAKNVAGSVSEGVVSPGGAGAPVSASGNVDAGGYNHFPYGFNDRARGWIAEDDKDQRRKATGTGGEPPALIRPVPVVGSIPVVGLAFSAPSDMSAAPTNVLDVAASIAGLKVLPLGSGEGAAAAKVAGTEGALPRVFWSGGPAAKDAAATFAQAIGGTTLDVTAGMRSLEAAALPPAEAAALLRTASGNYATRASGHVHVFLAKAPRADSIWRIIEQPALRANPAVTGIRYHLALVSGE